MSELKIPQAGRFERTPESTRSLRSQRSPVTIRSLRSQHSREASLKQAASSGRFLDVARNDLLDFRDVEFAWIAKEFTC
ncbi:MAG: hypothetical protein R6T83_12815, partial [Salinibacter sp.]